LSVLVIWEPMYPGDSRSKIDQQLFDDQRVTSFWDPHEVSGTWFGKNGVSEIEGGIVWDAFYAFAPATRWDDRPDHVVASGAPIIGGVDTLQDQFVPLISDS
jgi:hypothetical protein